MEEVTGKRKPKGPIKFQIVLTEEQKQAKATILDSTITVLKGSAGSGKSMVAAQVALDLLFRRDIQRIVLTRPAVTSGEEIGFLPGDKDAKLAPYTAAVYDNMYRLYRKDIIDKHIQEGNIEVIPLAFMRGRTFKGSWVVADEMQNATPGQIKMLLTRLGEGSKIVVTGDTRQADRSDSDNGLLDFKGLVERYQQSKYVAGVEFERKDIARHPAVKEILDIYGET